MIMSENLKVARSASVTGHRPKSLWGYDLSHSCYIALKRRFKSLLMNLKCTQAYTGMALGTDTIFAEAVLELKESGHNIQLICVIPMSESGKKMDSTGTETLSDHFRSGR